MGKGKKVTVGWKYFMGLHLILCHGEADQIEAISFGERLAWEGLQEGSGNIYVNSPKLFGGDAREGGVQGNVSVCMGEPTQIQNDYLLSRLGSTIPAYRGVVGLVFKSFFIGSNNPYVKNIAVRLRRMFAGWSSGTAWYPTKLNINGAMNAAHIIYQCLTDPEWGMGYPTNAIDDAQFRASADTLFTENLGLCLLWNQQAKIEEFIKDVVDHIGAVVRVDARTGLFQLQLIRDGYSLPSLYVFDESNITTLSSFQRPNWGETTNEIVVGYTDMAAGTKKTIGVQDLANIAIQGAVVSASREYPGIVTDDVAARIAIRDLRAASTPLAKLTLVTNREGFDLTIGDVAKISWAAYGIVEMPIRILNVSSGTLTDGAITLEVVEDIFGLPTTTYVAPQPINFVEPNQPPLVIIDKRYLEIPYWDLVRTLSQSDIAGFDDSSAFIGALATPAGAGQYGIELLVYSPSKAIYELQGESEFCPACLSIGALGYLTTTVSYSEAVDLDLVDEGSYALIGDELIKIVDINTSTQVLTIARGVLDTVPTPHAAGSKIYFADGHYAAGLFEYLAGETISAKLLSTSAYGVLNESLALADSVPLVGRFGKPYPAGKLTIQSRYFPDALVSSTGKIFLTWAHRSRVQQTATLVDFLEDSIGPEMDTTYTVSAFNTTSGSAIFSLTGITGSSAVIEGIPLGETDVRVEVSTQRGAINSYQKYAHLVQFSYPALANPTGYTAVNKPLNGTTGLVEVTPITVGTVDTGWFAITLPFMFNLFNTDYGNNNAGGVFVSTNSFVTFGQGSGQDSGFTPASLLKAITVGAGDRSIFKLWAGTIDGGLSYTIRYEGDLTPTTGTGITAVWEMRFYPDQVIMLTVGAFLDIATELNVINDTYEFIPMALAEANSYLVFSNTNGTAWKTIAGSR